MNAVEEDVKMVFPQGKRNTKSIQKSVDKYKKVCYYIYNKEIERCEKSEFTGRDAGISYQTRFVAKEVCGVVRGIHTDRK